MYVSSFSASSCSPPGAIFGSFGRSSPSGALADIGDTTLLLRELVRRPQVEPGALILLGTGLSGSAASVAVWVERQRFFRGA